MEQPTLIVIADYGVGDPAFSEVTLRLRSLIPGVYVIPHATPAFSTVNTGFWIYQLALASHGSNTFIFSNTAPRKHDTSAQKNNFGEKLMYAKLENGFEIIAVNAGYCFSFIKPHIQDFCYVKIENEGSQFRSRDFYPKAVAKMIQKDGSFLGEKADPSLLPGFPDTVIASIDGYGNMKTTIRFSSVSFAAGQRLTVSIGQQTHEATFTDGVFNVHDGELAFAPGSSGHHDKFMELFVRGGNARRLFGNPSVEQEITIAPQA